MKEELKKKNATVLYLYGLQKMKKVEETKLSIEAAMGEKNILMIFFPGQVGNLHKGAANVQCLNPIVYRQWVGKTKEIMGKHVSFTPHPRSLEGTLPPSREDQEKFGFCDIATAIVSTMEATQNAPKEKRNNITHGEIADLVEKAVSKGNEKLKQEMHEELGAFKEEIVKEANIHAKKLTNELQNSMQMQMEEVKKQLRACISAVDVFCALPQPRLEN